MNLPPFTEHWFDPDDKLILRAYNKIEKKLLKGEFVDVGDNIGYLCFYAQRRSIDFRDHLNVSRLIEELLPVTNYPSQGEFFYPHAYAEDYIEEAYLITKDYDTYWNLTYGKYLKNYENKIHKVLSFPEILNFYLPCSEFQLTGHHIAAVVGISEAKITKFGKENVKELLGILDSYLEDFSEREGVDPFHYFKNKYVFPNLTDSHLLELKPYIKPKRYESLKGSYRFLVRQYEEKLLELERYQKKDPSLLSLKRKDFPSRKEYDDYYNGFHQTAIDFFNRDYKCREYGENSRGEKLTVPYEFVPQIIEEAFQGFCNQLLRECENLLRVKKKLPRIGEGWIGETQLYYFLKNLYSTEIVVNHGRPNWLGRQHLDIYFPVRNLAIEYQGLQHDQPIDFFGGEDSFMAQKERDERKAHLCKENGCKLIYVRAGYEVKELEMQINDYLSSQ
ncbi:hypothetical protein [Planomicrobium okeanokoites]|uniref:hypothetical protein n=1 Tax=Planomicrobium okeanokoites TaxID=244 RepID=UPI0030FC591C